MNINFYIKHLIDYALEKDLITEEDKTYTINKILSVLSLDKYELPEENLDKISLEEILDGITDYAVQNGLCEDTITQRDLFDTKLMGELVARPGEVIKTFNNHYLKSSREATDYFYKLSCDSNYIRTYRTKKDLKWTYPSSYGTLDITINLSKPEKDPKEIEMAKLMPKANYPKCQLCRENEGYAGNLNHNARQNLRIIPLVLDGEKWFLQYSPYVYYNEHCIVFNSIHKDMKIDASIFKKLLEFVSLYPHYFIGSNADLPIVGGSILSHEHFQGGRYDFPMARAEVEYEFKAEGFEDVNSGILNWPMSVIRLSSENPERLSLLADRILSKWINYTDEDAFIFSHTSDTRHNTITPVARKKGDTYELDLVLRNNITTSEHPLGVFHPHGELHNIKKENIGLIEVMGLAVLPARLNSELELISETIIDGKDVKDVPVISKHSDWVNEFLPRYNNINKDNISQILETEVGRTFEKVLEHSGVFKRDEKGKKAFKKFILEI